MEKQEPIAVREAKAMQLSTEQLIKFIMRMAGCDYATAKLLLRKTIRILPLTLLWTVG